MNNQINPAYYEALAKARGVSLAGPATTAGVAPLNGIAASLMHDEGAIARCSYCGRYSLDPATLSDRQPICECGKQHGWCGSFEKPGPDSRWSGKAPSAAPVAAQAGQVAKLELVAELKRWAGDDPGYAAGLIRSAVAEIERLAASAAGQAAPADDDLLDVARTLCSIAARRAELSDEKRKHYPHADEEGSPLLTAARAACVARGYTQDGLAINGVNYPITPGVRALLTKLATRVGTGSTAKADEFLGHAAAAIGAPAQASTPDVRQEGGDRG